MHYKTLSRNGERGLFVKTLRFVFKNKWGWKKIDDICSDRGKGIELVFRCGVLPIQTGRPYSKRYLLSSFFLGKRGIKSRKKYSLWIDISHEDLAGDVT